MQLNLFRNKAGSIPRTSGMCEAERYKSARKKNGHNGFWSSVQKCIAMTVSSCFGALPYEALLHSMANTNG